MMPSSQHIPNSPNTCFGPINEYCRQPGAVQQAWSQCNDMMRHTAINKRDTCHQQTSASLIDKINDRCITVEAT